MDQGRLLPGMVLPKEVDLALDLGVSRQTVNHAYSGLAGRGLVNRIRGVGTFVAPRYVEQPLDQLYSFIHTLLAQGRKPGTRILGRRLVIDDIASMALTGMPGKMLTEIKRIRLVDDEPFVIETVMLEQALGEAIPVERIEEEVLYEVLADCVGIEITHAEETLHPVVLDREQALLLGLDRNEPAFLVERIAYAENRAVEFRRSVVRGDRYQFKVTLQRNALTTRKTGTVTAMSK